MRSLKNIANHFSILFTTSLQRWSDCSYWRRSVAFSTSAYQLRAGWNQYDQTIQHLDATTFNRSKHFSFIFPDRADKELRIHNPDEHFDDLGSTSFVQGDHASAGGTVLLQSIFQKLKNGPMQKKKFLPSLLQIAIFVFIYVLFLYARMAPAPWFLIAYHLRMELMTALRIAMPRYFFRFSFRFFIFILYSWLILMLGAAAQLCLFYSKEVFTFSQRILMLAFTSSWRRWRIPVSL